MHTDETLEELDHLTKLLGQGVQKFAKIVCPHYNTVETPREQTLVHLTPDIIFLYSMVVSSLRMLTTGLEPPKRRPYLLPSERIAFRFKF